MSHYSAAIFTTDKGQSIDALIAPYDDKWDWYTVGGRWKEKLILKSSAENPKKCNAAYVRDIDFRAMRRKAAAEIMPYREAMNDGFMKESYMNERYPTEAEYIKRVTGFSTYAVVTPDGQWHAPGNMSWWGMSSETPEEERAWELSYYERFIKPALEHNWYLVIVDCHI